MTQDAGRTHPGLEADECLPGRELAPAIFGRFSRYKGTMMKPPLEVHTLRTAASA